MLISLLFFFEDARLIWLQTCLAGIQHTVKNRVHFCHKIDFSWQIFRIHQHLLSFQLFNSDKLCTRKLFRSNFSLCYSTIKLSPQFTAVEYSVTLIKLNSPSSTPFGFSMPENVSVLLAGFLHWAWMQNLTRVRRPRDVIYHSITSTGCCYTFVLYLLERKENI